MKKLIMSSLAIAVITSCSSTNDEVSEIINGIDNTINTPYLVKKFTETTQDNQVIVTEYKYDGDKIIEEKNITQNRRIAYTYAGDNIATAETYAGTTLEQKREFTYLNGKLTAEKVTSKADPTTSQMMVYTVNYQYLTSTQVKFNRYAGATVNPSGGYTAVFDDVEASLSSNGNLASTKYTNNGTTYYLNNTFDNDNNPMRNVKGYVKINMFYDTELGHNNLISQSRNHVGALNGTGSIKGEYTLNSAKYPTKVIMKFTSSSFGSNNHTYNYEYNK
ncbi:hypothetical protein SAMN05421786_103337 [Chryseobacterium ureilyticum]|uniref:YD repeat-containing protein n=1 Tax=Chryseobacterium ureilyticum TaxID=373668 RepID=A0A1N7NA93_9FLAO|nr:hypothetical protein [Chryseobacterium ureilyticum]SIS95119.1 hypothetical protein SAMN05421786_103337 [Chryseobacterium ureilyticum]